MKDDNRDLLVTIVLAAVVAAAVVLGSLFLS